MNNRVRQRATRILLSSLLGSDLTVGELEQLANAFIGKDDIVLELGKATKEMISLIRNTSAIRKQYDESDINTSASVIDEALNALKSKRASKDLVLSKMMYSDPSSYGYFLERKDTMSLRGILAEFLSRNGITAFNSFIESIVPILYRDKYLKGIMENR